MVELKTEEEVLGSTDLVASRRNLLDDARFPRALGEVEIRELVVEAAVAPVQRQVLDRGVDDFQSAAAKRLEQAPDVGDGAVGRERVKLGLGLGLRRTEGAVLHVDERSAARPLIIGRSRVRGSGMVLVLLHPFAGNKP